MEKNKKKKAYIVLFYAGLWNHELHFVRSFVCENYKSARKQVLNYLCETYDGEWNGIYPILYFEKLFNMKFGNYDKELLKSLQESDYYDGITNIDEVEFSFAHDCILKETKKGPVLLEYNCVFNNEDMDTTVENIKIIASPIVP